MTSGASPFHDRALAVVLETVFAVVAIIVNFYTLYRVLRPMLRSKDNQNQTLYVITMALFHNALLCAFECAETVTAIVTNNSDLYVRIWPVTMFLYIANTFCSFALSINRSVAAFRPTDYERMFPKNSVKIRLCAVWPAALLAEIPFMIPGCGNGFDLQTYRRAFMNNQCGSIMVWFSMVFSIVELSATLMNVFTLVKIRRSTNSVVSYIPVEVFKHRRKQQLKFISQALSFSLSAFAIAVFINFISLLSSDKWWQFCTSNLIIPICCTFTALFSLLMCKKINKVSDAQLNVSSKAVRSVNQRQRDGISSISVKVQSSTTAGMTIALKSKLMRVE